MDPFDAGELVQVLVDECRRSNKDIGLFQCGSNICSNQSIEIQGDQCCYETYCAINYLYTFFHLVAT